MGFFGRFIDQSRSYFDTKTAGSYSFYNPFSRQKSFIKRKLVYYGSIIFALFVFLKSVPLIFANLLSGPKSAPYQQPYPPQQQQSTPQNINNDKEIKALQLEIKKLQLEVEKDRLKLEIDKMSNKKSSQ